jgi:tetratricopeptide (TPR) repeat protein
MVPEAFAVKTLYITVPYQYPDGHVPPLLVRELGRQAVMIAAREGLDFQTRDEVLGEWDSSKPLPADSAGAPLRLDVGYDKGDQIKVEIIPVEGHAAMQKVDFPTKCPENEWVDLPKFVTAAASVAEHDAPAFFQDRGYTGAKPQTSDKADLPAGIDDLLYQTTLLSAFSAVQQTHALIHTSGQSTARSGALVRGYANLGQLTKYQWSSINESMTARSLLYAQLMVDADPQSPTPYYHRAYAFAMAGLHKAALDDLTKAKKLSESMALFGNPPEPTPPWVELIEPLCKYDITTLQKLVGQDARRTPLAALCCFMDVEYGGSVSRLVVVGQAMLEQNPACFHIIDGMIANTGVSMGHQLTPLLLDTMLATLPDDIHHLAVVPATVTAALAAAKTSDDHIANLANVTASFASATEPAEPSFAMAGTILRESNFMAVMRRAVFLQDFLGADSSEYVTANAALIADHPCRKYVESLSRRPSGARLNYLKGMTLHDPVYRMLPMIQWLEAFGEQKNKMTGENARKRVFTNNAPTAYELEPTIAPFNSGGDHDFSLGQGREIISVSPYSGAGIIMLIYQDWEANRKHSDEWIVKYQDQPAVLRAIGEKRIDDSKFDRAIDVLRKCVKTAPDYLAYKDLAKAYLAMHDEKGWEAALTEFLFKPDYALNHSQVQDAMASHFIEKGEYDKARGFADAAAKSGSQGSLTIAAYADELCGDYTRAEELQREASQAYGGMGYYFWCKRTGKGDLTIAKPLAEAWVKQQLTVPDLADNLNCGCFFYMEGQTDQAVACFEKDMRAKHRATEGVMAALIRLKNDDAVVAEADLHFVVDNCTKDTGNVDSAPVVEFAKLVLANEDKAPPKDQMKPFDKNNRDFSTIIGYLYGRLLQIDGEPHRARENYSNVVQSGNALILPYILACDELHHLGVADTPLPRIKPLLQPSSR